MKKIKVGYLWDSYPHKRNIIDIVSTAEYQKIFDYHKFLSYIAYIPKKFRLPNAEENFADIKFGFNDFNLNQVDILHFVNNVSYGKKPWVSTFETFIPRYSSLLNHQNKEIPANDKRIKKALKAISSDSCKKIIAMSESAARFEAKLLNVYPEYMNTIKDKMTVIHPPQKLMINSFDEKEINTSEEIRFIMVGGDFFRKGGIEVLNVFEKLVNEKKIPLKLTIISSLDAFDYATKAGQKEINYAESIIKRNKNWIRHERTLPNQEVLNLMKSHHVGLLPTWADTYGYSVLEMQACGCPVITTDVRALSEINKETHGWLIEVPKNDLAEALYNSETQRNILSRIIETELERILLMIEADRESIKVKSDQAIEYIKKNHSPETYENKIRTIYENALR